MNRHRIAALVWLVVLAAVCIFGLMALSHTESPPLGRGHTGFGLYVDNVSESVFNEAYPAGWWEPYAGDPPDCPLTEVRIETDQ